MYKPVYKSKQFEVLAKCVEHGDQISSIASATSFWILYRNGLLERRKIKDYNGNLDKFSNVFYHNNMYIYNVTKLGKKVYKEIIREYKKKKEEYFYF